MGLLPLAFQSSRGRGSKADVPASARMRRTIAEAGSPAQWIARFAGSAMSAPAARHFRPGVEIVDMVAHEAAMAPELRTAGGGAHLLQPSWTEPEIESRLLRREKRAALL